MDTTTEFETRKLEKVGRRLCMKRIIGNRVLFHKKKGRLFFTYLERYKGEDVTIYGLVPKGVEKRGPMSIKAYTEEETNFFLTVKHWNIDEVGHENG